MHSDAASQGGGWCALRDLHFARTLPSERTPPTFPPLCFSSQPEWVVGAARESLRELEFMVGKERVEV